MSATDWELVCGLEVHVHLKTRTKMFCRCALEYGAAENTHTCPICLAHPGALPAPNTRAVEMTILLGLALDCEIADRAIFARKNYFYPDLPKGYQISQYEAPLCGPGRFTLPDGREIGIVRAHLEEDAAKTVHAGGATGRSVGADYSLVDFNRGGTPLLEIVSAPDLRSADEAMSYLRLLRQTIRELGVSDADMEKGTLRADVNVSVRRVGEDGFRPRWEIKNMNSFRFIGRAIEAAFRQQVAAHEAGEEVVQSTLRLRPRHRPADRASLEGGSRRLSLLPGARPRPGRAAGRARRAVARRGAGAAGRADRPARGRARRSIRRRSSSRRATNGRRRRSQPRASI